MMAGRDMQAIRRVVTLLLPIAAMAAVLFVVLSGREEQAQHRLVATVADATNLLPGQELKAGGGKIGTIHRIDAIEGGKRARITLAVEDRAWPLARGTTFATRFGGTASFYNRHILVTPGPAGAPALAEGGAIPAKDFVVPVEVDRLLAVFDARARTDLKSFVNRTGATLDRSREPLTGVLAKTPQALSEGAAVLTDVTDDRGALSVAVVKTDDVVDAVRRADPGLTRLLTGAASTFDAIADRQQQLRVTLDRLPAMLDQTQTTLRGAENTLTGAGRLARRLGPGVRELRAIAKPLDTVLASLQDVAPDARATLSTVRRSTPQINAFLARATKTAPQLASIAGQANESLRCIRPYAPELQQLTMTWADFMSYSDGKDKVLRAQIQNFLPANYNSSPSKPAEIAKTFPGLRYGFPRPPGYNAGQPWYLPECGAGLDAVDPAKDQEAQSPNDSPIPAPAGGKK